MTDAGSFVLTSATAHEASGRIGALPSTVKPLHSDMYLNAPAFPVHSPAGDNLWLHRAVYAAEPGSVLVVDVGDGVEYGYWGEILAEAALARGLSGLVINGGVRDSRRLITLGWPTFSAGVCIRGTGKNPEGTGSLAAPVVIGDVTVARGDLVIGDADGVVCIPAAQADEVLRRSRQREDDEADYITRLRNGESTLSIYDLPARPA